MLRDKIMLVDDEVDITSLVDEVLSALGYTVKSFNDPIIALEFFKTNHSDFGVILSDIRMPKMSGIELVCEISKIDAETKVILMSAFDITEDEIKDTAISQCLLKPIHVEQLAKIIGTCMNSPKAFRSIEQKTKRNT